MQPLHTKMPLFLPEPVRLFLMRRHGPTAFVKLLLTAPALHHYFVIVQAHRDLAIAALDIAGPGIVRKLLEAFGAIVPLDDPEICYYLSVNHSGTLLPQLQVLLHPQEGVRTPELLRVGATCNTDHRSHERDPHERMEEGQGERDKEGTFAVLLVVLLADILGRLGLIL